MNNPSTPLTSPLQQPTPPPKPPRKQRLARVRAALRSRPGRIIIPVVALLLGIMIGIGSLVLYGLQGDGKILSTTQPGKTDITVEVDKAFITSLVRTNLLKSGAPGMIENVQVDLANGDQMTINADDTFTFLGIGLTRHFTLVVQPYVSNCLLQIHVVHADVSGIPVTGFVTLFESNINQQLKQKPSGLPDGFLYCTSGVRTATAGMIITYSATPV
ncbi:MAG TPA: hypothetical protein VNE38_15585 [Ktedonobacteraceae bacterium]|nr:hypothetical protein [Ktedonobacteraceae bacterium]